MSDREMLAERVTAFLDLVREIRATSIARLDSYDGTARKNQDENTFVLFLSRATQCVGALECLLVAGWRADATSLLRTLADIYLELLYIETDRAGHLARYNDFGVVESLWWREREAAALKINFQRILESEYERVKAHIEDPAISSATDYEAEYRRTVDSLVAQNGFEKKKGWSPLSARKKALAIDSHRKLAHDPNAAEQMYESAYHIGSVAVHAGFSGIAQAMSFVAGNAVIQHGPDRALRSRDLLLLIYVAHLYLKILDNVNDIAGLGLESELRRLDTKMKAATI